ncbi:hypothetical protein SAMN05216490_4713 [Mucilaginibacter mallensis]|uniref:DUF3108 domain-containing protein n=1 Tax=Mucilaginibacter mallensis TaxID=652787 RepID=A0A1H2C801_MUCMA|nr:hypothetical protein [Mucilaginibacter mallensis]SDT66563.1 hypothetical protein SAMN05216490_4713 [Mucilaginibacter mallensis]
MKKIIFIIALLLITSRMLAQDCSQYMYMKKNKVIESTCYNEKGEVLRKVVSTVVNVTTINGTTTANVSTKYFDKNGKPNGEKSISYKCNGGSFIMDMGDNSPQQGNANIKFTASSMEYPSGMKVGDRLKSVTSQVEEKIGGVSSVATSQIERTVVAKENVTTPAGTWNCFKIVNKTTTTIKGYKMAPFTAETTEWYVPNFGIVKVQVIGLTTEITALR